MMGVMRTRSLAATGLLAASFLVLAVSVYQYVWPGTAQAPRWLPEPKVEALVVPPYPVTVHSVEMGRGDTLVRALRELAAY